MNYFNRKNIIIWILVVLFIINVTAIATIFYQIQRFKRVGGLQHSFEDPPAYIQKKLGLNEKQAQWFHEQHIAFRDTASRFFDKFNLIRTEMADELSKENPDRKILENYANQYGELHKQLKMFTIEHFLSLREKCTPEQQQQLDMFMRGLFEHDPRGSHKRGKEFRCGKESRVMSPFGNLLFY